MKGYSLTGWLVVLCGLFLAMMLLPSETIDDSALLKLLFKPMIFILPWGPPILFGWLFERLGSSQSRARRASRVLSGIAIALAVMFWSFMTGMAGRLVMPVREDAIILGGLLAVALASGLYGFRRDQVETRL